MSALAFFRNPTSETGVLCDNNFDPLTLHGVRVAATIRHGAPIVTVSYEYRNQTASSQKVFAAFAVPKGWRLLSSRADASMGIAFVRTLPPADARTAAPLVNKGVTTLQVPWSIMVGQYIVVQAVFLAPSTSAAFTIPKELFPVKVNPVETAAGWRGAFSIQAPSKFKEGCAISVEGVAALPLAGIPEVNNGAVKATGTLLGDPKGFRIAFDMPSVESDLVIRFPFKPAEVESLQMQLSTVLEANRQVVSEKDAFAVVTTLNPAFTTAHLREPNAEFIFVFGLGNGIAAKDVEQVKDAFHAAVAGLPPSCNVNAVCCVGSDKDSDIWLSNGQSLPISGALLEPFGMATAFINKITTYAHSETKNGIVVRTPMKRSAALVQEIISTQPFIRGLARNIVLITTDGGDTQAAATSQMVMANRHSTSVSAVALSYLGASDAAFLNNLASLSNGTFVDCKSPDTIIESILELVSVLAVPALTQINIHYTDSNAASPDGSSAPTVSHCGVAQRDIPFIRAGEEPQWLYAFADARIGQLTVKIEGLIGSESMQYVIKTPKEAIASAEQSSCAKGNALSLNVAHLAAAALRQDQLIRADGANSSALSALTQTYGIPTYRSYFAAIDESGTVSDDLAVVAIPNPMYDFCLSRKGALSPEDQNNAITVVSSGSRPYGNVAADKTLQARLVQFGEVERRALQKKAQDALEARKRREKAIGIDDQETADASYAHEQLQIDSIRNPAAEYLGGEASLRGGSTGPRVVSTMDFFRSIVQQLIGSICEPLNVNTILQSQQVDGSVIATSARALACLGVTSEVLTHIPSAIANKDRANDIWVTIIALARIQNDPRSILFQRKARVFLSLAGVEPDQHEAHAQHVLASS